MPPWPVELAKTDGAQKEALSVWETGGFAPILYEALKRRLSESSSALETRAIDVASQSWRKVGGAGCSNSTPFML